MSHPPIDFDKASEKLWRSYAVINEWIRFADVKAGALLTIDGVVFGAALSTLKDENLLFLRSHPLVFVLAFGFGACLVGSAIASLECIRPRVNSSPSSRSLIFFEEIAAEETLWAFRDAIEGQQQPEAAFIDIQKQVWLVSKVASRKHKYILWSVRMLYAAILTGVLLLGAVALETSVPSVPQTTTIIKGGQK